MASTVENAEGITAAAAVRVLQNIASHLNICLEQAKSAVSEDIEDFSKHKVSKLFQMVGIYSAAFKSLNVGNRKEFEHKIGTFFRDTTIQEAFDEMLQTEREINDLLLHVDAELSSSEQGLGEGDVGPVDMPVINARSGEQVCLREYLSDSHSLVLAEVKGVGGKILIISFGERPGALRWLEDTHCPFDMLLDIDRNIYTAFGLFRSISKVWNISCLTYYAEQMTAGTEIPKPYENVHDDPIQMGGNFILDGQGLVKMSYPSKTSIDRPSVDDMLSVLRS